MPKSPKYLTDEHGKRIGVVLAVKDYAKMIEALEDLDDIRAYDEARPQKKRQFLSGVPSKKSNGRANERSKSDLALSFFPSL